VGGGLFAGYSALYTRDIAASIRLTRTIAAAMANAINFASAAYREIQRADPSRQNP
jgi:hypothetical protein